MKNKTLTRHETTSLDTFINQLKEYIAATPLYDGLTYQLTLRDSDNPAQTIGRRITFKQDLCLDNPITDFTACHTYQFDNYIMRGYTITTESGSVAESLVLDNLADQLASGAITKLDYAQKCENVDSNTDIEFVKDFLSQLPFISQLIYCYDHSDRCYSTKPFNCRFDSGAVAVAYVDISKFYTYDNNGHVTNPDTAEQDARTYLASAVESWLHWLNNEYYCACYYYPLTREEHTTYTDEQGRVQYEVNKTTTHWEMDFSSGSYSDDNAYEAVSSTYYIKDIVDITLIDVDEEDN